jgi:hypothetical protein
MGNFGQGIQLLFDASQRYTRAALPVYLRVKNFKDEGDYIEVGVPFAPTGVASFETGYTDILITPPPSVQDVSLHNIGLLAGRLNFGSRVFLISNTWVLEQMAEYEISDPYDVFRKRDGYQTIGLLYNDRLFSIESLTHTEVAGQTIRWKLIGNALELASDSLSHASGG